MRLHKYIILISLLFLVQSYAGYGQSKISAQYSAPKEVIDKIKVEGMGKNSQVMKTASYLTDTIGGRLTNSPNMLRANSWTKEKLSEWGLSNSHLESWGPFGRGWSLKEFSAEVVSPQSFPVIAYPNAWSPSTKGQVLSEIVLVKIQSDADFENYKGKLRNKIVLIDNIRPLSPDFTGMGNRFTDKQLLDLANAQDPAFGPPPRAMSAEDVERFILKPAALKTKRVNFLIDEGVAAIIENSDNGSGGTLFVMDSTVGGTPPQTVSDLFGNTGLKPYMNEAESKMLPQMTMATEDYNRLLRMIENGDQPKMRLNIKTAYHDEDLMGYNTIAEIPGSDPQLKDEIVIVGAHLDSWHSSGGATDNAAGSASVMEAVRIIKALDLKPRRTIRVALWSGEEQGLLGSKAYVTKHFGEFSGSPRTLKPAADYEKISAYFNMDNGTGKFRGIYSQGNTAVVSIFRKWLEPFNEMGAATVSLNRSLGSDQVSFDVIGIPGFQFIQDPIEYRSRTWHSSQDNFDRLIADDLKQNAVILAAFAYQTAMMDEKLPRK